jgi:hypothetical protein
MRNTQKCITACVVLLSFVLVISTAGATADNNSSEFDPDTYQLPPLQFEPLQEKVRVNEVLKAEPEMTGTLIDPKRTAAVNSGTSTIPSGSIIYYSADGVTTVFDKNGIQLFSADDAQAAMIPTPAGMLPATHVHTFPSGSNVYHSGNVSYIIYNNEMLNVEIHEKTGIMDIPPVNSVAGDSSDALAKSLDSRIASTDLLTYAVIESAVVDNPAFSLGNDFTARWIVPDSPHQSGSYSPIYLSLGLNNAHSDPLTPQQNIYKSIIEYDYEQSSWSMSVCNYYHYDWDTSWFSRCSEQMPVNAGDTIEGGIEYIDDTGHSPPLHTFNVRVKDDTSGQLDGMGLGFPRGSDTITQLNINLQGDIANLNENTIIGDTTFAPVNFPVSPKTYMNPSNPQIPHLNVENLWPDKIVFHTLDAPEPEMFTFSITNTDGAIDKKTGKWTWNEQARDDITYMTTYFKTDTNWNNVHWDQKFSEGWPQVTKGNFGVNPLPGEHTLNEATLHYHTGHGYSNTEGTYSFLHLLAQDTPLPNIDLVPTEVEGKWGGNNKWVILSSCLVLRDQRWGNAFASSHPTHGIMGYKTESYPRNSFMKTFFEYAKTNSIRDSYLLTVKQLDLNSMVQSPDGTPEHLTAVVVFSNENQAINEFLPGYGSGIQPDADPVDPVWDQWPKKIDGGV